eukprot:scaffold153_cov347-Pavlova_lutheri.AAC.46
MSAPPTHAAMARVSTRLRRDGSKRRRREGVWKTCTPHGTRVRASSRIDEADEGVAATSSTPGDKYWRAADVAGTAAQWMGWIWMAFAAATEASAPPAAVAAAACGTLARRAARRKLQAEQERLNMLQMEMRLAKGVLAVGEDAKAARGAALAAARTVETAAAAQAEARSSRNGRQQEHLHDKERWETMRAFLDARLSLLEEAVEESASTRQEDVRNAALAAVAQAQARILPPATSIRFPPAVESEDVRVGMEKRQEITAEKEDEVMAKLDQLAEMLEGMQLYQKGADTEQYRDEDDYTYQDQGVEQNVPIESWIESIGKEERRWSIGTLQEGFQEEVNDGPEISQPQNGEGFADAAGGEYEMQQYKEQDASDALGSVKDADESALTSQEIIDVEAATWYENKEFEGEDSGAETFEEEQKIAKQAGGGKEELDPSPTGIDTKDDARGSKLSDGEADPPEAANDSGIEASSQADPAEAASPYSEQDDAKLSTIEVKVRRGLELLRTGRMQARASGSELGKADANLRSAISEFEEVLSSLAVPYPSSTKRAVVDFGDDGKIGTKRRLAVVATGNLGNTLLARAELQQRLLEVLRNAPPPPPADYEATVAAELQLLEEIQDLLVEAGRRFRQVLQLTALLTGSADREEAMKDGRKVDSALRALFNWGTALSLRALIALDSIEEADSEEAEAAEDAATQLYFAALEKFERAEQLSRDDESMARALRGEAQILQDLALLPSKTPAEKRELLKDALFRLDDAIDLARGGEGLLEARDECALLLGEVTR